MTKRQIEAEIQKATFQVLIEREHGKDCIIEVIEEEERYVFEIKDRFIVCPKGA